MHPKTMKLSALLAALVLSLVGCDEKRQVDVSSGQVAVKVDGEVIEARQVEGVLRQAGVNNPAQAQDMANRVLDALLEQHLFAREARNAGLDQDADVARALRAAQDKVLAQAYFDKVTAGLPAVGEQEVTDYYGKHPELFAERRLYRLQEILIQISPESAGAVKARLGNGADLQDLVAWLKSQNIPARGVQSVKSAEQLPLELAARLHPLKDGQAILLENPRQFTILAVTGSQRQPLSLEQARPGIEDFLLNRNKREKARQEIGTLRAAAKIEYQAPYAEVRAGAAEHALSVPKDGGGEQGVLEKALSGFR